MAARVCLSLALCLAIAKSGPGAEPQGTRRPHEVLCHCQFVELSPRAVEEFYTAADLVTARSAAKRGPEFGVGRRAEVSLQKLSLGGCAKRFDWPPVVATSGKPASVLSGGEFPILIPAAEGRVAVLWKRFGHRADVVPRWLETGRLQLAITAEIASKDFSHAVTSNGLTVPGLTTRRVCARVELNLGETAVVNLGPEATNADDDDLVPAPSKTERPAAERTITLFLVRATAATRASGEAK
jgi:Bacterial type II and III secretion system protein